MYLKKGSRILLVEDEDALREVMAEELRDAGYDVVEADGVVTALVALAAPFDVLLTDIRMGRFSGWDLAETARRKQPDIDVIYMTGYSAEPPKRVERSLFLMKPCTVGQLLDMTSTCCKSGNAGSHASC